MLTQKTSGCATSRAVEKWPTDYAQNSEWTFPDSTPFAAARQSIHFRLAKVLDLAARKAQPSKQSEQSVQRDWFFETRFGSLKTAVGSSKKERHGTQAPPAGGRRAATTHEERAISAKSGA